MMDPGLSCAQRGPDSAVPNVRFEPIAVIPDERLSGEIASPNRVFAAENGAGQLGFGDRLNSEHDLPIIRS
jgi:hypothetical protein